MRLKNKIALVTGATSGIGQATAQASAREGAECLAAEASRVFGPIEIVVNNAGTFSFGPTAATTEAAYDAMMDTNVKGPFFLTTAPPTPASQAPPPTEPRKRL